MKKVNTVREMPENRESWGEFLRGPEFTAMLKNLVTEAVAEGVTRAIEAAITRITALEELTTAKARLHAAEQRIEELDNQNRKNCVIINGVPETNDETVVCWVMQCDVR